MTSCSSKLQKTTRESVQPLFKLELPEVEKPKQPEKPKEPEEVKLTLSFAGDCTLGSDPNFGYDKTFTQKADQNTYDYFFSGVRDIFEQDDFTLVNLETTLTNATVPAEKEFRFKGKPDYTDILLLGGVEMVNIANNHIHDYFDVGFNDTLANLQKAGIFYSGYQYIGYYQTKGVKIASLGYSGNQGSLQQDIAEARKNADIVIVSFHIGGQGNYDPTPEQIKWDRLAIDYGADLVIGHHPHVINGIEQYKGKYIVYSLGNFCYGGHKNPPDKDTFIFQSILTLKNKKIVKNDMNIIPCSVSSVKYVNDYRPIILEGVDKQHVLDRIYQYSSKLEYGIKNK
jgi:poly-gamma-glutamate synthesis protein (capsule biosynthesis protein)